MPGRRNVKRKERRQPHAAGRWKTMERRYRTNMLLVELMIVILFFALSVSVPVRMLFAARRLSDTAGAETRALSAAQNVADALTVAEDQCAWLSENGFLQQGDRYLAETEAYTLTVTLRESAENGAGALKEALVTAEHAGEMLFTLDCTRYEGVTP